MQERVLGSIIMGGIAILGVVWAVIEGVPPLSKAKKQESELESKIVEKVNNKYGLSLTELDIRRVTFVTRGVEEEYRGGTRVVPYPLISLEGFTEDEKYFKCDVLGDDDYILDLQQKIGSSVTLAHIALEYDIYQNYSMTLSELLNTIVNDRDSTFESFSFGDGLYGRLQSDAGVSIYGVDDTDRDYADAKIYTVEEAIEAVKDFEYGERSEEEVFLRGTIEDVVSSYDESAKTTYYTFKLVTNGKDDAHRFEIFSAKTLDDKVDASKLVVGATVTCKGYLSTNMAYKEANK